MSGFGEFKEVGGYVQTAVAIYSYLQEKDRENYKKRLIVINKHWQEANRECSNHTYANFYQEDAKEGIKISSKYIEGIVADEISIAGSMQYQLFKGRIIAARNVLIKYGKQRVKNAWFKEYTNADEISAALNFSIIELEKCISYDASDFDRQQANLKAIQKFIKKISNDDSLGADDDRAVVGADFSAKIDHALSHLIQMNQNRTSVEQFRGIAAKSHDFAENALHFILGVLQPKKILIEGSPADNISLLDPKDLRRGKIFTKVSGICEEAIDPFNPFRNEIIKLAACIADPLSSEIVYLSIEELEKKINLELIKKLKANYNCDMHAATYDAPLVSSAYCPMVLFKGVRSKDDKKKEKFDQTFDVHEQRRQYTELVLLSGIEKLPKKEHLKRKSVYLVKKEDRGVSEITLHVEGLDVQKINLDAEDEQDLLASLPGFPADKEEVVKDEKRVRKFVSTFGLDASIEERLYQVASMINLTGALTQLNRFSHLVARHASLRGDVAVYTEQANRILFDTMNALATKIEEFYLSAKPLLDHTAIRLKTLGSHRRFSHHWEFYNNKVSKLLAISGRRSLLEEIRKLSSFCETEKIEEDARENERRLKKTMNHLNQVYSLQLDTQAIDRLGRSVQISKSDKIVDQKSPEKSDMRDEVRLDVFQSTPSKPLDEKQPRLLSSFQSQESSILSIELMTKPEEKSLSIFQYINDFSLLYISKYIKIDGNFKKEAERKEEKFRLKLSEYNPSNLVTEHEIIGFYRYKEKEGVTEEAWKDTLNQLLNKSLGFNMNRSFIVECDIPNLSKDNPASNRFLKKTGYIDKNYSYGTDWFYKGTAIRWEFFYRILKFSKIYQQLSKSCHQKEDYDQLLSILKKEKAYCFRISNDLNQVVRNKAKRLLDWWFHMLDFYVTDIEKISRQKFSTGGQAAGVPTFFKPISVRSVMSVKNSQEILNELISELKEEKLIVDKNAPWVILHPQKILYLDNPDQLDQYLFEFYKMLIKKYSGLGPEKNIPDQINPVIKNIHEALKANLEFQYAAGSTQVGHIEQIILVGKIGDLMTQLKGYISILKPNKNENYSIV